MENKNFLFFLILFCTVILNNKIHAQVTVGSDNPSEQFALLQIKENQPTGGEATATSGGFLLPRVKLTTLTTLSDLEIDNPTSAETKREHVGLMVFNVSTTDKIIPGLYVWDENQWTMLILE